MIPIVAGLLMGAAVGGGIAALQKKDVLQGALMGGIGGALGGAFMPGAAGVATGETVSAATAAAGNPGTFIAADQAANAAANAAAPAAGTVGSIAHTATPAATGGTGLFGSSGGIGNFLTQNKGALIGGALGGSMAPGEKPKGPDEGNVYDFGFEQELNPRRNEPGQSYYTQRYNLKGIQSAEDYDPYKYAAEGGIVGLADGGFTGYSTLDFGNPQDYRMADLAPVQADRYAPNVRPVAPEVAAYNQQMMQRANQQYNINPRPIALQIPGLERPATPVASSGIVDPGRNQMPDGPKDYIDDYYQQMLGRNADPTGRKAIEEAIGKSWYDPARDIPDVIRKSAEFKQAGKNPNPTGIEIGKKYGANAPSTGGGIGGLGYDPKTGRYTGTFEAPGKKKSDLEKMREELDALKSEKAQYQSSGNDGNAAGGLMRYAMGGDIGTRYQSPDDTDGMGDKVGAHQTVNMAPHYPMQGLYQGYADGGHLGGYSDGGRLLKGPGDGVSDDIPAQIGRRQPARLADGEFVVPARIVSELGNGSTDAGAKRLYAMMDRVQNNRRKSVGKGKVAVDSKAYKHLPA